MSQYIQKALTINEQVDLIHTKHQIIIDLPTPRVKDYLTNISFCRLNVYFPKLQGDSFSKVIKYYELDRKLRLIILDAIERIEIAIKTIFINKLREFWRLESDAVVGNALRSLIDYNKKSAVYFGEGLF